MSSTQNLPCNPRVNRIFHKVKALADSLGAPAPEELLRIAGVTAHDVGAWLRPEESRAFRAMSDYDLHRYLDALNWWADQHQAADPQQL